MTPELIAVPTAVDGFTDTQAFFRIDGERFSVKHDGLFGPIKEGAVLYISRNKNGAVIVANARYADFGIEADPLLVTAF